MLQLQQQSENNMNNE